MDTYPEILLKDWQINSMSEVFKECKYHTVHHAFLLSVFLIYELSDKYQEIQKNDFSLSNIHVLYSR